MNFYAFNIGDYAGATRHLSWDEDMAYRRLLDAYYSREAPLPLEIRQVYRLVSATEDRQREAVQIVLSEFFDEREDGWHNNRADEEIAKTNIKKEKARQSAAVRWQGVAPCDRNANASSIADANASEMPCEGNAPNPNPNPNPNSRGDRLARDLDADLEAKLRTAAGWEAHPNPKLAVTGPIQALLDSGADLDRDVLPVIKALAPKVRSPGWTYFVNPIAEARDQRIAAATIVSPSPSNSRISHAAHRQKPSRDETFAAIDRRIEQLAEAERRAAGGGTDLAEGPAEG